LLLLRLEFVTLLFRHVGLVVAVTCAPGRSKAERKRSDRSGQQKPRIRTFHDNSNLGHLSPNDVTVSQPKTLALRVQPTRHYSLNLPFYWGWIQPFGMNFNLMGLYAKWVTNQGFRDKV
jgi:hypothetical protein